MEINNNKNWLRMGVMFGIGVLAAFMLFTVFADKQFQDLEQETRLLIADQQSVLVAIAETTARNGADAVTEGIVKDCEIDERSEFEDLLGKLDKGLSASQLATLERLFGRCGPFYSERKLVMVARLAREIEVYRSYIELLSTIENQDLSTAFSIAEWEALAVEEQKQSELFAELVSAQDQIISALILGKTVESPEMKEILQKVREIQETLIVANKQASVIRGKLVSL